MPTFLPVPLDSYVDTRGYGRFSRQTNKAPPNGNSVIHLKPSRSDNRTRRMSEQSASTKSLGKTVHFEPQKESLVRDTASEDTKIRGTSSTYKKTFLKEQTARLHEAARPRRNSDTLDYLGLNNMMRKVTLHSKKTWKQTNPPKENNKTSTELKDDKENDPSIAKENPVKSMNYKSLRNSRSSNFTKYRYPKAYHSGSTPKMAFVEENLPQCLKRTRGYHSLPVRQSCHYDPFRSVTHLKVHSVKSEKLPHPPLPGNKQKRPESAPPIISSNGTEPWANESQTLPPDNNGVYHFVHGVNPLDADEEAYLSARSPSPDDESAEVAVLDTISLDDEDGDKDDVYQSSIAIPETSRTPRVAYNPDILVDNYDSELEEVEEDFREEKIDRRTQPNSDSECLEIEDETINNWQNPVRRHRDSINEAEEISDDDHHHDDHHDYDHHDDHHPDDHHHDAYGKDSPIPGPRQKRTPSSSSSSAASIRSESGSSSRSYSAF